MKPRHSQTNKKPRSEMKGVVKKITGKLRCDPKLEAEGQAEMQGKKPPGHLAPDPDPHRRG